MLTIRFEVQQLYLSYAMKDLTEQTLYLMAHELLEIKEYSKGKILCNMSKYSIYDDKIINHEIIDDDNLAESFIIHSKNEVNDNFEGIYIIKEGRCGVIHSKDNYEATSLIQGDIFGESEYFSIRGYDFFGDIVAQSQSVKIWFI